MSGSKVSGRGKLVIGAEHAGEDGFLDFPNEGHRDRHRQQDEKQQHPLAHLSQHPQDDASGCCCFSSCCRWRSRCPSFGKSRKPSSPACSAPITNSPLPLTFEPDIQEWLDQNFERTFKVLVKSGREEMRGGQPTSRYQLSRWRGS